MANINLKDFKSLINGLYQAEGLLGAYFQSKGSLNLKPNFAIGQNYSKEAVILFLQLQHVLGGIGYLKLELSNTGSVHVKFVVTKATDILNIVIPYLNQLHGQKRRDLQKFSLIYNLAGSLSDHWDPLEATQFLYLVYSLNPDGNKRKLTLDEKLEALGLSLPTTVPELPQEIKNKQLPSIPFIIGFFLGDGTLGVTLDDPPARYPMVYVKLFFEISQKTSTDTLDMFTLFSQVLSEFFQVSINSRGSGSTLISVSGKRVGSEVLPLLSQFYDLLYWKTPQYDVTSQVATIVFNKGHLSKEGLKQIVRLLYSSPVFSRK